MINSQSAYSDALGKWLSGYEWTHWATFTSRPILDTATGNIGASNLANPLDSTYTRTNAFKSSEPSRRMYRRGLAKWAKRIGPEMIFWGTEAGPETGRIHCHALLKLSSTSMETNRSMWMLGYRMFGRTYIEDYDPELGAAGYIAKYVTKRLADYDLWVPGDGF